MTSTPVLRYTYGLPASGKTTYARELVKANSSIVRANLDDIRLLLHGPQTKFSKAREKAAVLMQDAMITAALIEGHDVICDDTNLNPRAQSRLAGIAESVGAELVRQDFSDVPLGECIKRDALRGQAGNRSVGEDVIRGMWDRWLKPAPLAPNGNPECVVFDVDGTLALMGDRSPYDWARVAVDTINPMVAEFARSTSRSVVVLSGRDGSCRTQTFNWLILNGISFVELLMRKADDMRPDWVIKNELVDDLLTRWYPVLAVDDRQQVVDNVWRARGIECWQVAPGRF